MERIDFPDLEAIEHPLANHHASTAASFLRRLEDQDSTPRKTPRLCQVMCCSEKHGRMTVMAASVHATREPRRVWEACCLLQGQRIHVGPQPDRLPGTPTVDDTDDAGLRDSRVHFIDAELAEALNDEVGSLVAVERQLWVLVQVPAPCSHLVCNCRYAVDTGHVIISRSAAGRDSHRRLWENG
jgi:hypothetical protein